MKSHVMLIIVILFFIGTVTAITNESLLSMSQVKNLEDTLTGMNASSAANDTASQGRDDAINNTKLNKTDLNATVNFYSGNASNITTGVLPNASLPVSAMNQSDTWIYAGNANTNVTKNTNNTYTIAATGAGSGNASYPINVSNLTQVHSLFYIDSSGTNVLFNHDAQALNLLTVASPLKNITINNPNAPDEFNTTLNLYFEMGISGAGTSYAQIYRNGVAVGTLQSSVTYPPDDAKTEQISGWSIGDKIGLWGYVGTGGATVYVDNFRILGTKKLISPTQNISGYTNS